MMLSVTKSRNYMDLLKMEEFSGVCNRTQKKCTEYLAPVFHLEEGPTN